MVSFVIKALSELDSASVYQHNWHIELICKYLQDIYTGKMKRLIINIPPRSLKSICVSVVFPAWVLANKANEKIIAISYSQGLSLKHSTDCRKIMQSNWYKKITKTRISYGENEKRKFITNENGYRFATSVCGTLTGEGGNYIIIDDPQNPLKINQKSERDKVDAWFDSVAISRLNDKKNGKIIIVMQRLHVEDLAGYLIAKDSTKWNILSIPAIETNDRAYYFNDKLMKFRKNGDILHHSRDTMEDMNNIIHQMGSSVFAAQYQQNPIFSNGIIDKNWFDFYHESIKFDDIYYSIDTAVKQGEKSDYTVILKIGMREKMFYVMDIFRRKIDYIELKKKIINEALQNTNACFIIEDKNIGSSLIQDLKRNVNNKIICINPTKDKLTRLINVIGIIESKRVLLQQNAKWVNEFLIEATSFPNCVHDDQIDALTQFLSYISSKMDNKKTPSLRFINR